MNISVCLATYNGEKYVLEQIKSVLPQLADGDELIVVDDGSKDKTIDLIHQLNSSYIKVYINEKNLGHVKTFEKLLALATNELIFMCDQDDIWKENKIQIFKDYFSKSNVILISDNSYFIDKNGNEIEFDMVKLSEKDSEEYSKNIFDIYKGRAGYYGCAMGIRKDLLKTVLPIPAYVESHDLWIAMAANLLKSNLHIDNKTFYRRIHGENDSLKKRKLSEKLYSRYIFVRSQLELEKRIKKISR
jgi:glycosyltransferase involved in cell wall biosynthesis